MDIKKERRRKPPLRVEVLELRIWWTADPPWPFQLRPVPQYLCLWAPVAGLLLPPYFSTSFGLPIPQGCARFVVGFQNLRSFHLSALPACAFRTLDLPLPKLLPVRIDPEPKLFLIPIPDAEASSDLFDLHQPEAGFRSVDLVRLAPPGVYLKGSRLPFESPFNGTTGFLQSPVRATYSVPGEYFIRLPLPSVICLPAGRPSGRWVPSNGVLKLLLKIEVVNAI